MARLGLRRGRGLCVARRCKQDFIISTGSPSQVKLTGARQGLKRACEAALTGLAMAQGRAAADARPSLARG